MVILEHTILFKNLCLSCHSLLRVNNLVLLRYDTWYVGFPEIPYTVQNTTCFKKLENTTCAFIYNLMWK